jgi:uncharacterized protein
VALVPFLFAVFGIGILSGATASVLGFGIGSMLTPLLAAPLGASLAIAAVSLPHAVATAMRCWRLRHHVALDVLRRFGLLSAVGGLMGALIYTQLGPSALGRVLGVLLLATAVAQWTGAARRWKPVGLSVSLLGLVSGLCGGLAGNQGGIRAAALSSFGLKPRAFVATATATALLVDAARTPVYLWQAGSGLLGVWQPIAVATVGVLIGTWAGERMLAGLSPAVFSKLVAAGVGVLGLWLLVGG